MQQLHLENRNNFFVNNVREKCGQVVILNAD